MRSTSLPLLGWWWWRSPVVPSATTVQSLWEDRFWGAISLGAPFLQRWRPFRPPWPQPRPHVCDTSLKFSRRVYQGGIIFWARGKKELVETSQALSGSCRRFFERCQMPLQTPASRNHVSAFLGTVLFLLKRSWWSKFIYFCFSRNPSLFWTLRSV